jgi:lipopolysaccharide export system permease protein
MTTQLMRYVGLEVLSAIVLASFALVGLLAVFTVLEEVQDFRNQYQFFEALTFVALSLPRLFYETIPFSVLIGGLVGLGGLAARSELLIMRASGISVFRILGFAMVPALAFALLGTLLGEFLLPSAEREARLGRQQARAQTETIAPEFGVWTRDGEAFLYLEAVNNDQITGLEWLVFDDQQSLVLRRTAEGARYIEAQGDGFWEMTHVIETRFVPQGSESEVWKTKRWTTAMTPMSLGSELLVQPERMSVQSLFQKIATLESQALNSEAFRLGFWAKVFQPFVAIGLLVLAASAVFGPLRETSVGMRIFSGLVVGVLFKFVQDLLAPVCLVYGVSPILAILLPVLACAGIGGWQLRRVL